MFYSFVLLCLNLLHSFNIRHTFSIRLISEIIKLIIMPWFWVIIVMSISIRSISKFFSNTFNIQRFFLELLILWIDIGAMFEWSTMLQIFIFLGRKWIRRVCLTISTILHYSWIKLFFTTKMIEIIKRVESIFGIDIDQLSTLIDSWMCYYFEFTLWILVMIVVIKMMLLMLRRYR